MRHQLRHDYVVTLLMHGKNSLLNPKVSNVQPTQRQSNNDNSEKLSVFSEQFTQR
jgi:hypothetical protein